MRLSVSILLAIATALPLVALSGPQLGDSALEPPNTGGLQLVDKALVKLSSHRRLLVVGAHPDDEDTTLLSLVGAGMSGEAAYLSLSRGEGGQNLIGTELGIGLGLIRTGELLAARQIEGTRQFFTRAYDFGYTRSLDETFDRWPREELLIDGVRAVRRFKPQIIVGVFPSDARAGHGQHQAAGVIAQDIFEMAGAPDRFPELTAAGFPPWQPEAFFRRVWRNREPASLEFPLGQVDPFSGRSVLQMAGASRSMHRSQDMGTLQQLGSRQGGLTWVAGEAASDAEEVFGGIDTSLASIADLLPSGTLQNQVREELTNVEALATESRTRLTPSQVSGVVPALAGIVGTLEALLRAVESSGEGSSVVAVTDLLREKWEVANLALASAAGVVVDAVADREVVAIGESISATLTVWNSGHEEVLVESCHVESQDGWQVSSRTAMGEGEGLSGLEQWKFELQVPQGSAPTMPYFLQAPLVGDLYSWDDVEPKSLGLALQAPPAVAVFELRISGAPIRIVKEIVYRVRDQAKGEVRLPIRALPEIEVVLTPEMILWPARSERPREIEVLVRSNSLGPVDGVLEILEEKGSWIDLPAVEFHIAEPGGQQVLKIDVVAPAGTSRGRFDLTAVAKTSEGRRFQSAYPVVSYSHIRPMTLPVPASVGIQMLDLEFPEVARIGYIRGASDRVPEVLLEIGLPVELLSASDLRVADLSGFDAIVIGSRAYESDPVLPEVNHRLLGYVEEGGLLIVQYQQYQFVRGSFSPLTLEIDRPHGRVTDETAAIEVLAPEHSVFRFPNQISSEDWLGWVQERGLYFASSWDPAFSSLLSLHDEGQPVERGALLVANVGDGIYVYTGLSFFRQLPAGVPGAIRLLVNLLSMERS